MSCNSFTAIFFLCIHGANIRREVFSVMKIIFDYSKSSYDSALI